MHASGELEADKGQVFRQAGAVFSTLRQEVPAGLTGTVRTVVEGEGGAYEVHNDWERHDRVERLLEGMGLPAAHEFAAMPDEISGAKCRHQWLKGRA